MITITVKLIHPRYSDVDRIKVQADVIRVLEECAYNLPNSDHGTPVLQAFTFTDNEYSILGANIPGAMFNSHVSPYWFETLDTQMGELDRIWTATFNTEISEGN